MKAFALLTTLVALASANLQPVQDLLFGRAVFGNPPQGRIVGGQEAAPNSIPYQVGLNITLSDGKQAFCGGALVSRRHVLTAAHCCVNATAVEVILGAHNIYDESEPTRKTFNVPKENITVHEQWSQTSLTNDICAIKLTEEVEFTDAIKPIRIADEYSGTFEGETARASGWGKDRDNATSLSPVLREVYSTVISNKICNFNYFGTIMDTHICSSGDGGKSTCNGDSGGPLAVEIDNEWTLVGLTSFGIFLGCEVGWPAVFTRVSKYKNWIEAQTSL